MNHITQTYKESVEGFDEDFDSFRIVLTNCITHDTHREKILKELEELQSHIKQSTIALLESVVESIGEDKEILVPEIPDTLHRNVGYNQAKQELRDIIKEAIKDVKEDGLQKTTTPPPQVSPDEQESITEIKQ